MEFVGDEKKIRAQFCDLANQDQSATPEFEKLWARAESTHSQTVHRFGVSLMVFASAVVILSVSAVAVLLLRPATATVSTAERTLRPHAVFLPAESRPAEQKSMEIRPIRSHRLTKRRFIASRRASNQPVKKGLEQNVVALSNWQSPTEVFLQSPVTPVFKSLPALNQSVKELESYLSSNELKESKQ